MSVGADAAILLRRPDRTETAVSVQAMSWVFDHSESRGLDRLVLLVIANRVNEKAHDGDAFCWPTQAVIANEAKCSERSVRRSLDELKKIGELEVVHQGQHHPNLYRMTAFNQTGQVVHPETPRPDMYAPDRTSTTARPANGVRQTIKNRNLEPREEDKNQPIHYDIPSIDKTYKRFEHEQELEKLVNQEKTANG